MEVMEGTKANIFKLNQRGSKYIFKYRISFAKNGAQALVFRDNIKIVG